MNPISFLLDPNVAYLMIVMGFLLAILALFTPGTGFLELGALFAIILAGYGIYNLPFNLWALAVLLLGVIPFIFALRQSRRWIFLALSIVSLIFGSVFLFRTAEGQPAVDPLLAVVVSVITVPLVWFITRKGIEALQQARVDPGDIEGKLGSATTDIYREGSAYIAGEEWSAHSNVRIPAGSRVRVVRREGLMVEVEPVRRES